MNFLIPTDGSDLSLDAVRHGLTLVHQGLKASFVLAHVREPVHLYEVVLAPDAELLEKASHAAAEHALVPARALLDAAGQSYDCEIVTGDPAHELTDLAERCGCDAILISTSGAGLLSNGRIGRVCSAVVHHATVPVTVVRRFEAEPQTDADEVADEAADDAASAESA